MEENTYAGNTLIMVFYAEDIYKQVLMKISFQNNFLAGPVLPMCR
jgi:hypothetical protein